jgi:hypothetical protein
VKVSLDGMTLGGLFEPDPYVDDLGVEWILTALNGWWGSPGTRTKRTDRIAGPGAFRAAAYKGVRVIELGGVLTATTQSGYLARRAARQLSGVCSDPADLYPLVVQDELSQTCAYVELDGEILVGLRDNLGFSMAFSMQLAATDPRRFNVDWTTSTTPFSIEGSGGIVSTGSGISIGEVGIDAGIESVPAIASAHGAGTALNPQVLQVVGPASDFTITNSIAGCTFVFKGNVGTGESLYINLDNLPAYGVPGALEPIPGHGALLGRTNARAGLSVRGSWPLLYPGDVASYLITGSLGFDSKLIVHSRGSWS